MKIGRVKLNSNLLLAPMLGFTNSAFRHLCHDYGAGLVTTPLINENAVLNNPLIIDAVPGEAVQLIGSDPIKLSRAAVIAQPHCDLIDLNFGCPATREAVCGVGAILLKKPALIKKLVSSVVKSVDCPVTAKIRLGFDKINVIKVAKAIEFAGASAITVHARLASQDYSVPADWPWIKRVKESISIPVIGNGDVKNQADANQMISETNCDAVMIGRAAIGNPFIFKGVEPSVKDRRIAFKKLVSYDCPMQDLKLQALNFVKGLPGAARIKQSIMKASNEKELINFL
ncbi:MAG: tRNA-dihydrouridine synthase family protein [Candidatus Nanoarchaeia archaeon]|jgi:nifR3 family TIM-barrel protein